MSKPLAPGQEVDCQTFRDLLRLVLSEEATPEQTEYVRQNLRSNHCLDSMCLNEMVMEVIRRSVCCHKAPCDLADQIRQKINFLAQLEANV